MTFRAAAVTFLAVVGAALPAVGIWAWLGRPVPLPDVDAGRLDCLSYTVAYDNVHPGDDDFAAPAGLMASDIAHLKPLTKCIRTYSSIGDQGDAVAIAADAGIEVLLGIWIGDEDKRNEMEISRAIALAKAHPAAVRGLVVGNEVLLRREMSGARLAEIIRSVKQRSGLAVTYADVLDFWIKNPEVADAVDFMLIHVLPYWDDPVAPSIDDVQARVRDVVDTARAAFPAKDIRIGEIGWPSAGRTRGLARPSRVNQARFVREFIKGAGELGLPYNIIEAIDQPWKRAPEGTVGGYWGVLDFSRHAKFPLSGPVSEWPQWPLAAAFSVVIAAVGAVLAQVRAPAGTAAARIYVAALAGAAGGGLLWGFADQARSVAFGPLGTVWAVYLGTLAAIATVRVINHAAGRPATESAAFFWAVLLPAAVIALLLAIDGRHRDFLTLAFLMPAIALVLAGPLRGAVSPSLAWVGMALAVSGPLAIDHVGNMDALAWAGCCLLLAWPLRLAGAAELRRLRDAFR